MYFTIIILIFIRLEPYGKDGNLFYISFSPSEYGKLKNGKLIIETEELYWYHQIINFNCVGHT